MPLKRCVKIIAYNAANQIVYQHVFSNYEWYEDDNPIIDSYEERIRLGASKIEGRRYDATGELIEHWVMACTDTGRAKEEWVIKDGMGQHIYYPESGLEPVACLTPLRTGEAL